MNILIPDSWLREFLATNASVKDIARCLSLCGPSVEKTSKIGKDWVYNIEVTTNRVDCMSIYGIAREAAAILPQFGFRAKLSPYVIKSVNSKKPLDIKILNNPALCYRILAVKLENVKLGPSPEWLQERLLKVGQRPLNNAIDISNYVMWEVGHPTHVFDYDALTEKKIVVKSAKKGEELVTLDWKKYKLNGGEVVFDNGKREIIDLPGIMGTKNTVVTEKTRNVLLWIESIDAVKIRFASMGLAIRSQAAVLNEKHVDPELGLPAIEKAVDLFEKLTKGKVASKLVDIYPQKTGLKTINITKEVIDAKLGVIITKSDIKKYLKSLGFQANWTRNNLEATPPSYRSNDMSIEEDIIEEIARLYGYHRLPGNLMTGTLPAKISNSAFKFESKIKNTLVNLGGCEIYTPSLISKDKITGSALKLKNPLGTEFEYLRTSMLCSMPDAAKTNSFETNPYHLFEIANVYLPSKGNLPTEQITLAGIFANTKYREAKGIIEAFLNKLNIKPVYEPEEKNNFNPSQRLKVTSGRDELGQFGVLMTSSPLLRAEYPLKEDDISESNSSHELTLGVFLGSAIKGNIYYEFSIDKLHKHCKEFPKFVPIPKYPPQIEDITLVLPEKTKVGDIIHSIKSVTKLISSIELTDTYKNAYTFRINYQHPRKTLTDKAVTEIRKKLLNRIGKIFGTTVKN